MNSTPLETVMMKWLCIVLSVCWFSVINGNAVGHVESQQSQLQMKSDGKNVEVYRDNGDGSSWLQMLLMFSRGSSNNQSTPHIQNKPCTECEKTTLCKDGFIQLDSKKCYYFGSQRETWYNALKLCQSMATTLAYPLNGLENTALVKHLYTKHNGTEGWWLGGTDEAKEGEWVWTHNKAPITYADWPDGQPNNANEKEHCLQYYLRDGSWGWNDRPCADLYPFICQQ